MQLKRTIVFWTLFSLILFSSVMVLFLLIGEEVEHHYDRIIASEGVPLSLLSVYLTALLALDVVLPVPSSIISTTLGSLLGGVWGSIASTLGMTLSCLGGYFIGKIVSAATANKFVPLSELARLANLTRRWGMWVIVVCRPVPVLAEVSTIVAGIGRAPLPLFLGLCFAANFGISLVYASAGARSVSGRSFLLAFGIAVGIPALAWIVVATRSAVDQGKQSAGEPGSQV